jgi:hypothetical protein
MLIEIKDWRSDHLAVGDLIYHKRVLCQVISRTRPKKGKFEVKFKRLCKVKLKPYKAPSPAVPLV